MRPTDPKAFGTRVRQRREELGLSQVQLGKDSGYSQQRIVTFESGSVKRPDRCATALAEALRTTPKWLLWGDGPRTAGPQFLAPTKLVEKYLTLSPERKSEISRLIEEDEAEQQKVG